MIYLCAQLDLPFVDLAHDYQAQVARALAILTEPSPTPQPPQA
jgi:hypothetical protein